MISLLLWNTPKKWDTELVSKHLGRMIFYICVLKVYTRHNIFLVVISWLFEAYFTVGHLCKITFNGLFFYYLIRFRFNLPILKPPLHSHANSQSPGITAYLLIKYINIFMCQSSCMNSGKKTNWGECMGECISMPYVISNHMQSGVLLGNVVPIVAWLSCCQCLLSVNYRASSIFKLFFVFYLVALLKAILQCYKTDLLTVSLCKFIQDLESVNM